MTQRFCGWPGMEAICSTSAPRREYLTSTPARLCLITALAAVRWRKHPKPNNVVSADTTGIHCYKPIRQAERIAGGRPCARQSFGGAVPGHVFPYKFSDTIRARLLVAKPSPEELQLVSSKLTRKQRREAERLAAKREERERKARPPKSKFGFISKTATIIVGFVTLLGLPALYFVLRTDITVEKDISLDVTDPFATQFRVTDNGVLDLYDVQFSCNLSSMTFTNIGLFSGPPLPVLKSKDTITRGCGAKAEGYTALTRLIVNLEYIEPPKFLGRTGRKSTLFLNVRDALGHLQWVKQPTPDEPGTSTPPPSIISHRPLAQSTASRLHRPRTPRMVRPAAYVPIKRN
jgi:hypothetical protein